MQELNGGIFNNDEVTAHHWKGEELEQSRASLLYTYSPPCPFFPITSLGVATSAQNPSIPVTPVGIVGPT